MNPSLLDFELPSYKKSKRDLNQNAVKFRLYKLTSKTLRYEVIYKNLIRDVRKYFAYDFNAMNEMHNR